MLPLVIRVPVPQAVFNPDAVDTEVHCVNCTERMFFLTVKSESFTTVDENTGAVLSHGPPPGSYVLAPGESAKIGEVKGWEWDGHVGIQVLFRGPEDVILRRSYNLKESNDDYLFPGTEKQGRVIPPLP